MIAMHAKPLSRSDFFVSAMKVDITGIARVQLQVKINFRLFDFCAMAT